MKYARELWINRRSKSTLTEKKDTFFFALDLEGIKKQINPPIRLYGQKEGKAEIKKEPFKATFISSWFLHRRQVADGYNTEKAKVYSFRIKMIDTYSQHFNIVKSQLVSQLEID